MILYQIDLEDLSYSLNINRRSGRVKKQLISPRRPSTKGVLLILPFKANVKRMVEEDKNYPLPHPEKCP
jgi:hypothetical protein